MPDPQTKRNKKNIIIENILHLNKTHLWCVFFLTRNGARGRGVALHVKHKNPSQKGGVERKTPSLKEGRVNPERRTRSRYSDESPWPCGHDTRNRSA